MQRRSLLQWLLYLLSKMGQAVGHILIRRHAKDGQPGDDGKPGSRGATERLSNYSAGKAYMSGAEGELFYDIVYHSGHNEFFRCITSYPASETHEPEKSSSNGYWEWQQGLEELFANVLFANKAFIDSLNVNHFGVYDYVEDIWGNGLITSLFYEEGDSQSGQEGYSHKIEISPEYFSIYGLFGGKVEQYISIIPSANPDKFDVIAMMELSAGKGKAAIGLESGYFYQFRQPLTRSTATSVDLYKNGTYVLAKQANVTVNLPYMPEAGDAIDIIKPGSGNMIIAVSNVNHGIIDLVNNSTSTTVSQSVTVTKTVANKVRVLWTGDEWILTK